MQKSKTKIIAGTAVFSALCFGVSFLEFAIFPVASFLKLDFSNVFALIGGFAFGPIAGACIIIIKELLRLLVTQSGGVGELANIVISLSFVLLPTIVYTKKKGIKSVIVCLIAACLLQTVMALLANRFITFPLYMGSSAPAMFEKFFWYIVAFNLIKSVAVSAITFLVYKEISRLLERL